MNYLAADSRTVFIGQAVAVQGTAMRNTLENIESSKLIELPVEEDFQMGLSIGMALRGKIPVCIFPRWNFLLLATNQIVNHLDKLKELTQETSPAKVIIRTGIGSEKPLHPGPQHTGDFTDAFRLMCRNINVVRLDNKEDVFEAYKVALERDDGISTILVEWSDKYGE
jgi:pyruvate/2-oxoglutarate/acetoin dehydrogenase E1 component